jgi:hypothetical protein
VIASVRLIYFIRKLSPIMFDSLMLWACRWKHGFIGQPANSFDRTFDRYAVFAAGKAARRQTPVNSIVQFIQSREP